MADRGPIRRRRPTIQALTRRASLVMVNRTLHRALPLPPSPKPPSPSFHIGSERLEPRRSGALWWPDRRALLVADLHLEKGSGLARAGAGFLPPYDTRATLGLLAAELDALSPAQVFCLGDSFHDGGAADRIDPSDSTVLAALVERTPWTWIVGNHDPAPHGPWGGTIESEVRIGPLVLRHAALYGAVNEISGHYHPKATVITRARRITGRCFVEDGRRAILPAFGSYTGGLNVRDPAITCLYPSGFLAHLIGPSRIATFRSEHLAVPWTLAAPVHAGPTHARRLDPKRRAS